MFGRVITRKLWLRSVRQGGAEVSEIVWRKSRTADEIEGLRLQLVASVLPQHQNQSEDKHVESRLVPRLDESSNLSSSTFISINIINMQKFISLNTVLSAFFILLFPLCYIFAQTSDQSHQLYVGWSSKSITPDQPVALAGQFETRISTEVMDSVTCTALAIETRDGNRSIETAIMVSVDLVEISEGLMDIVRSLVSKRLPNLDINKVILNATHTHTGPVLNNDWPYDIPEDALQPEKYLEFAAKQIADAVVEAWNSRQPAGMSWGLGQAVVGHNRRAVYHHPVPSGFGVGTAVMYGETKANNFSHFEGYEDHGLEMLFFWNEKKKLTGMVLNLACPTQETEHLSKISADYWHEVRVEVCKKYGKDIFILPQVAAAADISPHLMWRQEAENEMLKRKGITPREEIARRIVCAIDEVYPYVQDDIKYELVFRHVYDDISLPIRRVTKAEASRSEELAKEYPHQAFWHQALIDRYNHQNEHPFVQTKINVLRLGDIVMTTNPFELFLDFGLRIKTRSKSILTFIVQLANGSADYVPTAKAEDGGGYSAIVQSNLVGSEGGQELVEKTLEMIDKTMK